ncbi:unnamed protein product [Oppiella nova]|uniref:Uncharacterized protein n=1 Tax=Oppiella nova TaxID=334625 RepID=A0A7R9LQ80_9ACAR|nr:unnamed protein product [Oppiella nova]CAG2165536.1 unnamed protein product [Oppiella nova]
MYMYLSAKHNYILYYEYINLVSEGKAHDFGISEPKYREPLDRRCKAITQKNSDFSTFDINNNDIDQSAPVTPNKRYTWIRHN